MEQKTIDSDVKAIDVFEGVFKNFKAEIAKVIVGQDEVIDQVLISIFSKGHCLLVGVPGLAKTLLVQTISDCLGLKFNRVLFDNMSTKQLRKCLKLCKNKYQTEYSGNTTLKNVKLISTTGIDRISVGAITHSAKSFDTTLLFR